MGATLAKSICQQGRDHWELLRGERDAPLKADFDPMAIPRLLPHVLLVDVIEGGRDFRYAVIGGHIRQYFLQNWTGRLVSSLPHVEPDGQLLRNFRSVVETKIPIDRPIAYVGPMKDIRKNDEVILPLLGAGGEVSHLLIFIEFVGRPLTVGP
ncbi:MAG: PAS domain-containing protein [Alphaproteobacteria bacterium]|nr:PAS domain-containing protein [Alphaproteobacteria bacterium]